MKFCSLIAFDFFWCSFEEIKHFTTETLMYSASLSPDKKIVVAGGEDFKIYRYSYEDGKEEGMKYM